MYRLKCWVRYCFAALCLCLNLCLLCLCLTLGASSSIIDEDEDASVSGVMSCIRSWSSIDRHQQRDRRAFIPPRASAPWLGHRRRLFEMNMGGGRSPFLPAFPFYAPIQLLPPFLPFSIPAFPFTFPLSLSLLPSPIFLPSNYPSYPPLSSLPYVPP